MEKYQETREKAVKNIKIADHMLTQTYPLVRDPKLLLVIIENIFLSLTNAIACLLNYERDYKRIPPFQDNFESKFNMFKMRVAQRYGISNDYLTFIQDIKSILVSHRKSPVEFVRKDVFVICSDDYKMHTINTSQIKDYIAKTKLFIQQIGGIVDNYERSIG
ncbi:hypothetical protein KY339_00180 [Candidatus Woesearchaeota archaeon]|nr:hypothetical protein [Candidatus Woesearchaeota archaeon]